MIHVLQKLKFWEIFFSFSVPYPESLSSLLPHSDSAHPIFSLRKLAVILRPGSFQSEDSGCGQCLCIQWLPSEGHCRIAAGFSNGIDIFKIYFIKFFSNDFVGIVCVWSLEGLGFLQHASVPLEQGPVLYPIIHLRGHIGPVRCLAWCPRDTKYLFSGEKVNCRKFLVQTKILAKFFDAGGADKWCFIWDLRQPTSPPVQRASRSEGIFIDDNYYFFAHRWHCYKSCLASSLAWDSHCGRFCQVILLWRVVFFM